MNTMFLSCLWCLCFGILVTSSASLVPPARQARSSQCLLCPMIARSRFSVKKTATTLRGGTNDLPLEQPNNGAATTPPAMSDISSIGEENVDDTSKTSSEAKVDDSRGMAFYKMGPGAKSPPGMLRSMIPSFPWYLMPDYLTYMRCIAVPLLPILYYYDPKTWHTSLLFGVASFTDWLDGFLARRWDISTNFGAFLDPVADKLAVSTALILLAGNNDKIMTVCTAIILAREIAVSALREWMAQRGLRDSVKVGWQGKCKTAFTMMALTTLLALPKEISSTAKVWPWIQKTGLALLYGSTILTVTSGAVYFKAAAPVLMERE
jgi:CDP-diacylglycerol--glycerol-3-phosphate 3-phosphatidyltransferase